MTVAYQLARALGKPVQWCTMPVRVIDRYGVDLSRPCVVAPTHISHLEPFVLSMILRHEVRWMARTEFYRSRLLAFGLDAVGAFPVCRRGYARPALREAIHLLERGERVGVFPEAGVARRQYSAMRGGPIKSGACFLAMYAQVPIVPVALIGTYAMNRVSTWRPFRHAAVHLAIGAPIEPEALAETAGQRRRQRLALQTQLRSAYPAMYRDLLTLDGVDDRHDLHPHEADDPARVQVDPYAAAGHATSHPSASPAPTV
ncbi:MAG: lysophospholipid acyltransferase family protein [Planctomycetota bacterium]